MIANAFFWGVISAIALPIGAFLGMWLRPGHKVNSIFMAFGGGALLFALTIELFGHVPHHVQSHGSRLIWVVFICAIVGGLIFSGLNALLNNHGAFMRRFSSARAFLARLKHKRTRLLAARLGRIELLNALPPELMASLLNRVQLKKYPAGAYICRQDEEANEMFFILDGQVEIIRHEDEQQTLIATLDAYQSFGELGLLSGCLRTADAIAKGDVQVYAIAVDDFQHLLKKDKTLHEKVLRLATTRLDNLLERAHAHVDQARYQNAFDALLDEHHVSVSKAEIKHEGQSRARGNAALAIWMGIFIDCIPESLVIGMLAASSDGISLAFIIGVFLANMPEAMSSSVSMRENGLKLHSIYLMWGSITVITGLGAALGAFIFPPDPVGSLFYLMVGLEALAAGAMLTMIAETMLPEAFSLGGSVVGLSTLAGFLTALMVKII